MADTIVNTPPSNDSGAAGWAVALIVLIAVIVGGFVWYRYYSVPQEPAPDNTNINITVPTPTTGDTTGTGGNTTP